MVSETETEMSKMQITDQEQWRQDATRPEHGRLADVFPERHVAIGVRLEVFA